jgi:ATP-dependent RNA helicase HelY
VIIHLPQRVRMIALSATVSNAEEFGDWLQAVRGNTDVIVSEERPVPLEQHVLTATKMVDLFDSSGVTSTTRVNPELIQMSRSSGGRSPNVRQRRGGYNGNGHGHGSRRMDRPEFVALLESKNLLPAIFFVFSRVGCDAAVRQVLRAGVRLTQAHERDEIRAIVEERCRTLRDEDLGVRRDAARVQGGRRRTLPPEARAPRIRHRDPRSGHQHAGAHRGAGEAGEVQR